MKILFSSPFLSYHGHIKRLGALKAESMAEAGLDVTVMGFPLCYELLSQGERLRYLSVQRSLSANARKYLERWSARFGKVWLFIVETFWVQFASLRYAREQGFPLVYIVDVEPWTLVLALILSGALWQRLKVVGFVSFLFNVETSMAHQTWYSQFRNKLNFFVVKYLPRMIDVVRDSKYFLALQPNYSHRLHVIPEGYERNPSWPTQKEARAILGLPAGRPILLLFGIANVGKGSDLFFDALNGATPSFDVCAVGQTGGERGFSWGHEHIADQRWRNHLRVVSRYVTEEERIQYFAACDAVALPYRLGFPGASANFRDAISFGKAVIVSDQFLMGEIVRKNELGILFKPGDVADLQRALAEFAQQPPAWFEGITERSKKIVEEYSWDKIGVRYRKLFEKLVATPSPEG